MVSYKKLVSFDEMAKDIADELLKYPECKSDSIQMFCIQIESDGVNIDKTLKRQTSDTPQIFKINSSALQDELVYSTFCSGLSYTLTGIINPAFKFIRQTDHRTVKRKRIWLYMVTYRCGTVHIYIKTERRTNYGQKV